MKGEAFKRNLRVLSQNESKNHAMEKKTIPPEAYTVHKESRGQPKSSDNPLLWQFYANKSDRNYQNHLKSTDWIKEELNLNQIPDRRTLNRHRKRITPEYLSKLNKLILEQTDSS